MMRSIVNKTTLTDSLTAMFTKPNLLADIVFTSIVNQNKIKYLI